MKLLSSNDVHLSKPELDTICFLRLGLWILHLAFQISFTEWYKGNTMKTTSTKVSGSKHPCIGNSNEQLLLTNGLYVDICSMVIPTALEANTWALQTPASQVAKPPTEPSRFNSIVFVGCKPLLADPYSIYFVNLNHPVFFGHEKKHLFQIPAKGYIKMFGSKLGAEHLLECLTPGQRKQSGPGSMETQCAAVMWAVWVSIGHYVWLYVWHVSQ